jgi:hypothetical protein
MAALGRGPHGAGIMRERGIFHDAQTVHGMVGPAAAVLAALW